MYIQVFEKGAKITIETNGEVYVSELPPNTVLIGTGEHEEQNSILKSLYSLSADEESAVTIYTVYEHLQQLWKQGGLYLATNNGKKIH